MMDIVYLFHHNNHGYTMARELDLELKIPTSVLNALSLLDLAEKKDTLDNLLAYANAVGSLSIDDLPAYNKALSKRNKEKEQDGL